MANYNMSNLVVEFDNSAGALQNMTQQTLEINGIDIQAILEESQSFGDSWVEQLFTGLRRVAPITVRGFYDDTITTGNNAIYNDVGCVATAGGTRTLKITWGGTKTTSVETIITSFKRLPARGEVTKYEVVLTPTGAVTEV
jgi:hypothetical protein